MGQGRGIRRRVPVDRHIGDPVVLVALHREQGEEAKGKLIRRLALAT